MTKFILVRHATPDYTKILNVDYNKYFSTCFAPLSEKGRKEAEILSKDPIFKDSDLLITSPFTRTMETAYTILNNNNLEFIIEPTLHEWLPDITVKKSKKNKLVQGLLDNETEVDRNFEFLNNVNKRATKVLEKYLDYDKVIVVAHKYVIYSLTNIKLQMGEYTEFELKKENKILRKKQLDN